MKKHIFGICVAMVTLTLVAVMMIDTSEKGKAQVPPPVGANTCQTTFTPYGQPESKIADGTYICRRGYYLLHDNQAKEPHWVAWIVSTQTVNGCVARSNSFATDMSLPEGKRSTPKDYAGSGYDQGHLANDSHQSWDPQVERESFLMSNMSPQLPSVNRGAWKLLETATGTWVVTTGHTMNVYAGNIYSSSSKTIGPNKVVVPDLLWKIVIDETTHDTLAFLFKNDGTPLGKDLTKLQVTVSDIEKISGNVFHLPPGVNKTSKSTMWPLDFKAQTDAKKTACSR